MEKEFTETAVLHENGYYDSFGINDVSALLYGYTESDIINVKLRVSQNQTIPSFEEQQKNKDADYWGWYDNEENKFTLIWHQRFLLDMCFPYGMKVEELRNRGKAYRLEVVND
jgi:hypothetical protein